MLPNLMMLKPRFSVFVALVLTFSAVPLASLAQSEGLPQGTGWTSSSFDSPGSTHGEGFKVSFQVELKGNAAETMDRITLEGETRVQNSRLDLYFKQKEREYQSSGSVSGMGAMTDAAQRTRPERPSRDGGLPESGLAEQMGSDSWGDSWGEPQASLLQGHFKLLRLQPLASTGNVTAELYIGKETFSPHLEALEVRLNPFKKTVMEVVMSGFTKVDLRNVRVVVDLDGPVKPEWKEQEFSAIFQVELQIGEYASEWDSGFDDEPEIQWVEDEESTESEEAQGDLF